MLKQVLRILFLPLFVYYERLYRAHLFRDLEEIQSIVKDFIFFVTWISSALLLAFVDRIVTQPEAREEAHILLAQALVHALGGFVFGVTLPF